MNKILSIPRQPTLVFVSLEYIICDLQSLLSKQTFRATYEHFTAE